jgi:3-dehydroquinate synthase
MPTVELNLPHHRYDIVIEPGALASLGDLIVDALPNTQRATLVTDEGVEPYHARAAAKAMQSQGIDTTVAVIPVSEKKKTLATVGQIYRVLLDNKMERSHPVVTLGGGICGDVAGFAAASYLRGVPLVQCPTSLLAMVDASVGGKTGVNMPDGKNLIGAFHQPSRVVIDPEVLTTLPPRELRCGLAECIKHAIIRPPQDNPFAWLDWIESHADNILTLNMPTLTELIAWNVQIKAHVVEADEKEAGERAHLNLGHTFAHAIEATANFGTTYKHGEAVALGMLAATRFAIARNLCPPALADRLTRLLEAVELPTSTKRLAPTPLLIKTMQMDKKVKAGLIRLVLPTHGGGVTIINDATADELAEAWDSLR